MRRIDAAKAYVESSTSSRRRSVHWEDTYSCYAGYGFKIVKGRKLPVHCGTCFNCKRRKLSFIDAGINDPSIYAK